MSFAKAIGYCEKSLAIDPNDESVIHCYNDILEAIELIKIIEKTEASTA